VWPENHSSAQRHRSRSEAYSGDRARDKMVLGSYQLFLYYLAVLVSVLGVLALFRGRELVEGRYSPVGLLVGSFELLALSPVLLDLLNHYLCFHLAAASASALPFLPASSNASIAPP